VVVITAAVVAATLAGAAVVGAPDVMGVAVVVGALVGGDATVVVEVGDVARVLTGEEVLRSETPCAAVSCALAMKIDALVLLRAPPGRFKVAATARTATTAAGSIAR